MALWGIALSNWGNPFGGIKNAKVVEMTRATVERAKAAGSPTPRERALIDAVAQLVTDTTPGTHSARTAAYEAAMASVIRAVEQRGRELLPEFRVFATGTLVLLNRTSDQIAGEQVQSVTIALLTIFAMLALLFRSLRVGLTALIPNLIPVLFFWRRGWF